MTFDLVMNSQHDLGLKETVKETFLFETPVTESQLSS